jgi:hypothetical protein
MKQRWGRGDTFEAYDRFFTVESLEPDGVWTRRKPLDPPVPGEPENGERGFFSWNDLDRYAKNKQVFNPPHFQDTDRD